MQKGFYFDQTRCIGCFTCCVACKDWNDIPAGPAHWRRITPIEEGAYPMPFVAYFSGSCWHCEEPLCATVCPAEAVKKLENGVVVVDREACQEKARCGITVTEDGIGQAPAAACEITCPGHVDVPGYIALVNKGKYTEALSLIREKLPLPGVLGRVCPAPCEKECKRGDFDEPLAIKDLKRIAFDAGLDGEVNPLPITKDERVAVIGSGPAGLSAAYDLVRKGYRVTIFEALPLAGGMMAVGIPRYRLPLNVLKRDIDYLTDLGIEIKTNSPIGRETTIDDLFRQGYAAVFVAVGAHQGRKLPIAGSEAANIMVGTSFLRRVSLGEPVALGKRVLVLGGGNIAIDCARVALRLGAEQVEMACLESYEEMPALKSEVDEGEKEGIKVYPSRTFTEVLCRDECAIGVECRQLRWMEFDKEGKLHLEAIEGSEHILEADTVIFAIGQSPELTDILNGTDIETTKRGTIAVNPVTLESSRPGVFAGGDAVTGTAWIIDAVAAGQKAAHHIDRYLRGELAGESEAPAISAADIKVEIPGDVAKQARSAMPLLSPEARVGSFREIALGYHQAEATAEAQRCLNCAGRLCLRACPYHIPQFGAEKGAKMQKCDLCLERLLENKKPACVDACIMRALDAGDIEELRGKYGDATEAVGFNYSTDSRPSVIFKTKPLPKPAKSEAK